MVINFGVVEIGAMRNVLASGFISAVNKKINISGVTFISSAEV